MIAFIKPRLARALLGVLFLVGGMAYLLTGSSFAQSGTLEWSRAIPISGALGGSRFPSVIADDAGNVYVFWSFAQGNRGSTIFVSKYEDTVWLRPIDVLIGGPRPLAQLDGRNEIRVMFARGENVAIANAQAEEAMIARGWRSSFTLNREGGGIIGDMMVDEAGTLYTVWFQKGGSCPDCYSIAYQKFSEDVEAQLTYRVLSDVEASPQQRLQFLRATNDTLYVMWDIAGSGRIKAGIELSVSTNGGETWLDEPRRVAFEEDILQPLIFRDNADQLVLVFNYGVKDEIFYSVTSDQGITWSEPQPIPGLFVNKERLATDYFASAMDSSSIVHIIAPARASKTQIEPALYHLAWDGTAWMGLQEIYRANSLVENPSLTISTGNRLHVAFAARDRNPGTSDVEQTYQILYTVADTDAPAQTRVPLPTFTPTPTFTPSPAPTERPTTTPTPTPSLEGIDPNAPPPSNVNQTMPIVLAVVFVVAALALVVVLNSLLRRR